MRRKLCCESKTLEKQNVTPFRTTNSHYSDVRTTVIVLVRVAEAGSVIGRILKCDVIT